MLRIAFASPNLVRNGVYRWLLDLIDASDPARMQWVGCYVPSNGRIDPDCAREVAKRMPIYGALPDHHHSVAAGEYVQFSEDAAARAVETADVCLAWEMSEGLAPIAACGVEIVLVSHSTWWAPDRDKTPDGVHFAAVSNVAAEPFENAGLRVGVVWSGVNPARVLPTESREVCRFRLGTQYEIALLYMGRLDAYKRPNTILEIRRAYKERWKTVQFGDVFPTHPDVITVPYQEHVGNVISACDCLVSTAPEAFGNAAVEAWMCGVPTVLHAKHGAAETLSPHMRSVRFCDEEMTAQDLGRLAEDAMNASPESVSRLREFALRELTSTAMAQRWAAHLERLVKPRGLPYRYRYMRTRYGNRPPRVLQFGRTEFVDANNSHVTRARPGEDVGAVLGRLGPYVDVIAAENGDDPAFHATPLPVVTEKSQWMLQMRYSEPQPREPEEKVRGLFLCPRLGFGGSERWMENIIRYSSDIQWEVAITDKVERMSFLPGVKTWAPSMVEEKLEEDWDVIVFWGIENVGQLFKRPFQGRLICVSHGTEFCPWTRNWLKESALMATDLCAVSEAALRAYPWHLHPKVDIVYQGVEFDYDPTPLSKAGFRDEYGIPPERLVIGYAGRGEPAKDPLLAAELCVAIPNTHLLHMGDLSDWPGDLRTRLQTMLPGRCTVTGHLADPTKGISACDVLLSYGPAESAGLSIMEAMMAGVEVIATPRSIVSELTPAELFSNQPTQAAKAIANTLHKELRTADDGFPAPVIMNTRLPERFEARACAEDFEHYVLDRLAQPAPGGTPLYTLSARNPPPKAHGGLDIGLSCDVVVNTSVGTATQALNTILAVLDQRSVSTFVHVVGNTEHLLLVRQALETTPATDNIRRERVRYVNAAHQSGVLGAAAIAWGYRTDRILTLVAGDHPKPGFLRDALSRMESGALAALVINGREQGTARYLVRKAFLLELELDWSIHFGGNGPPETEKQLIARLEAENHVYGRHNADIAMHGLEKLWCRKGDRTGVNYGQVRGIDVVLPFHGQFDYVQAAIDGLRKQQGCLSTTVHLIDDGSEEREGAAELMMNAVKHNDHRNGGVRFQGWRLDQNVGQFMAVNALVATETVADKFAIHDGDDISTQDRLIRTAIMMDETGCGLFSAGAKLFGGGPQALLPSYPYPHCRYYAINPATAIRTSEFERLGGYASFGSLLCDRTSLDTDFFVRAYAAGVSVAISNKTLVHYRQHAKSCVQDKATGFKSSAREYVERMSARQTSQGLFPKGDLHEPPYIQLVYTP